MNRTHLERVTEALAAQYGYAFYSAGDELMAQTISVYPAAWLSPLTLQTVEGRRHGMASYDMTLRLMRPGVRLSPSERQAALSQSEADLIALFAALSTDGRVLAIDNLRIRPGTLSLTPHGELSQTATARIVTSF